MTLTIKSVEDEGEVTPHLAMTHNELQGGAANMRNVSLLMKSDAEVTEEVAKALTELGIQPPALPAGIDSVTIEASGNPAVITKSQEEVKLLEIEIQKAVEAAEAILKAQVAEKEVALNKALEQIAAFAAEKQEAVAKSRKEAVAGVEKDEAKADELFKSLESLPQEAFDVVIKSLKAKDEVVENSDLFVQKSKDSDVEVEEVNGTAAILKAKHAK